jgi:hypothetical protein
MIGKVLITYQTSLVNTGIYMSGIVFVKSFLYQRGLLHRNHRVFMPTEFYISNAGNLRLNWKNLQV